MAVTALSSLFFPLFIAVFGWSGAPPPSSEEVVEVEAVVDKEEALFFISGGGTTFFDGGFGARRGDGAADDMEVVDDKDDESRSVCLVFCPSCMFVDLCKKFPLSSSEAELEENICCSLDFAGGIRGTTDFTDGVLRGFGRDGSALRREAGDESGTGEELSSLLLSKRARRF